ncbi:hypothetical protein SBRCBS47491_000632 [Sporothrix bragantina]|uniref:SMP-30/Gluconolactonase/LRE-like region domain-containing protein n=1 Tax=Sporothrix bragantina TaxID=671064 RepID=A0ABP0AS83_9PEZI
MRLLVASFYGRPFNSVNDVVVSQKDGAVWFTDPNYGHEQGIRPQPSLPNQVYRFDPATNHIRAMAYGFGQPNGICFSPDESTVYITDTDWIHGNGTTDPARASTIYAFDVAIYHGQPFLVNRQLFAMADTGIPDGIKCDVHGNGTAAQHLVARRHPAGQDPRRWRRGKLLFWPQRRDLYS